MIQLKEIDSSKLSKEILDFAPIKCMDCGFDGHIPRKFFMVLPDVNREKEYNELQSLVKKQLGYNSFSECYCDAGFLISVCRCPRCGSEKIFKDFR